MGKFFILIAAIFLVAAISFSQVPANIKTGKIGIYNSYATYIVGDSMKHPNGDTFFVPIVYIDFPFEKLKENYCIIFRKNEYFIAHRIIRREKDGFVTKGDNNEFEDPIVKSKDYIGLIVLDSYGIMAPNHASKIIWAVDAGFLIPVGPSPHF